MFLSFAKKEFSVYLNKSRDFLKSIHYRVFLIFDRSAIGLTKLVAGGREVSHTSPAVAGGIDCAVSDGNGNDDEEDDGRLHLESLLHVEE